MEISAVLSELQSLRQRSDELLVDGDSATAVLVKTTENELGWRVSCVQQLLTACQSNLASLWSSDFEGACSEAERLCDRVEVILKDSAILPDDADEATLTVSSKHLDRSLVQLVGEQSPLEAANRQAYVLLLSATKLDRLQRLNYRSHDLLCRLKDRCREVRRRQLLTRCDDAQGKYDAWLQFVQQIELELNSPLAGNFDALQTQQKTLEASVILGEPETIVTFTSTVIC